MRVTIKKCSFVKLARRYVDVQGQIRQLRLEAIIKNRKRDLAPRFKWLRPPLGFLRSEDGTSAVEFAMIALPFLAIIFATLQTAILLMAQEELETAVEKSGRLILTGQAPATLALFTTDVCKDLHALFNCSNLMINMQTSDTFSDASPAAPTLTYNAQGQVTNTWSYQPGSPGSIEVLQVMYQWPVFGGLLGFNLSNLPNGNHLLMATSVFKNEP
ncbi:MAG TPA: TadE/TadG family type IV pilus assembly protein [Methylovirgula sp.]|nr:TadE/TadG family type IV pilus assembly protein [Methylovirgula sp.]